MNKRIIIILLLFIFIGNLYAQPPELKPTFSAGAGVLITDTAHKGIGTQAYPLPFLSYRSGNLLIEGPFLSYSTGALEPLKLSFLIKLRSDGYDADDSSDLNGMKDRKLSFDGGLALSYELEPVRFNLEFLNDICGRHKGQEVRFWIDRRFQKAFDFEKLTLTPAAGIAWRSGLLNDYYYGVNEDETALGRPAYDVSSDWQPFVGLSGIYRFDSRWTLITSLKLEWLASEITDSPIVDQHQTWTFLSGLAYSF